MSQQPRSSRASPQTLPPRPNLNHLKNAAKSRLKELRQDSPTTKLAEAQLVIAREYGFQSWRSLRAHVVQRSVEHSAQDLPEDTVAYKIYEQSKPREEVPIDLALLDGYVGEYQLSANAIFTVIRQGDRLFVKLTGQVESPVYPESAVKFFSKAVRAQITFINDNEEAATALVLHQNGHEKRALRVAPGTAEEVEKILARRIKDGTPAVGSELALRRQVEAMMRGEGEPDYSEMTPELAEVSRPQVPVLKTQFSELGSLHSISFFGVGRLGWDAYRVEFENGRAIFRINLNDERSEERRVGKECW